MIDPPKALVLGFAAIIALGAILLHLPVATQNGQGLPWIDALFTATSAVCVTGLVVVDTGNTFSLFGEGVILSLIQVGGLGFMTFATLFALLLGKRISLRERLLLQESFNLVSTEGIVRLVRRILIYTAVCELFGGFLLFLRFSYDMPWDRALYYGMFHAISNFNNAGFDLMGPIYGDFAGLVPYAEDPVVTLVITTLIILGGIGFIVMNELYEMRYSHRLSLHSKVVLATTGIFIVLSTLFIYLMEMNNPKTLGSLSSEWGRILASYFQAVAPRTAGSNTLPIGDLHMTTQFFIIMLMFIGASPGSTGGGIKTTTFATLVGAVAAMIKGREDVVFFRQRIQPYVVYKALTVTMISLSTVFVAAMMLSITEPGQDFLMILFEATSAFGTVGLSMGLTPELSETGKIIITLTMFAGRLGPLTIAFALAQRKQKEYFRYPKGKIMVG